MNRLPIAKRVQIVSALVEGNSLRATSRMADVSINTVTKLLVDVGMACAEYHDAHVRNVTTSRVQCDEIWSFVGAKARNVTTEQRAAGWGDCWTWTAIAADEKLIVSYGVGPRTPEMAADVIADLASRLSEGRVQISTDGLPWYAEPIERAFGIDVDYGMIRKHFGTAGETTGTARYSPPKMTSMTKEVIKGDPNPRHISTSFVERNNLTMRMGMRRFTRLTNGFSKKVENHAHAVALHFLHYNFARIHKSLRVTPAMAAGLADHAWTVEEIVALLGD